MPPSGEVRLPGLDCAKASPQTRSKRMIKYCINSSSFDELLITCNFRAAQDSLSAKPSKLYREERYSIQFAYLPVVSVRTIFCLASVVIRSEYVVSQL